MVCYYKFLVVESCISIIFCSGGVGGDPNNGGDFIFFFGRSLVGYSDRCSPFRHGRKNTQGLCLCSFVRERTLPVPQKQLLIQEIC